MIKIGTRARRLPKELLLFLICSGTAAITNVAVGYLLYNALGWREGWHYGTSVALAFLVGMAVSFGLNRRFTFARSGRRMPDEWRTFFVVSIGGLLLTVLLSGLLRARVLPWLLATLGPLVQGRVDLELTAHVGAVGLVAGYSFLAHKYVSFGMGMRPVLRRGIRALQGGWRSTP